MSFGEPGGVSTVLECASPLFHSDDFLTAEPTRLEGTVEIPDGNGDELIIGHDLHPGTHGR